MPCLCSFSLSDKQNNWQLFMSSGFLCEATGLCPNSCSHSSNSYLSALYHSTASHYMSHPTLYRFTPTGFVLHLMKFNPDLCCLFVLNLDFFPSFCFPLFIVISICIEIPMFQKLRSRLFPKIKSLKFNSNYNTVYEGVCSCFRSVTFNVFVN